MYRGLGKRTQRVHMLTLLVSTCEKTASEIENVGENNQFITMVTYYKMRNGIWKTDEYTYKYRLILSGNMLGGREQSIS